MEEQSGKELSILLGALPLPAQTIRTGKEAGGLSDRRAIWKGAEI